MRELCREIPMNDGTLPALVLVVLFALYCGYVVWSIRKATQATDEWNANRPDDDPRKATTWGPGA